MFGREHGVGCGVGGLGDAVGEVGDGAGKGGAREAMKTSLLMTSSEAIGRSSRACASCTFHAFKVARISARMTHMHQSALNQCIPRNNPAENMNSLVRADWALGRCFSGHPKNPKLAST